MHATANGTTPKTPASSERRPGDVEDQAGPDGDRQADEQRDGRIRAPAGRPAARVRDADAAPAAAVRAPRLRVRLDAHRERAARAGRDAERGAVREQSIPELDLERRVRREDRVLGELGANAEPPRRGLHPRGRLALRVPLADPAEERDARRRRRAAPAPSSHAAHDERAGPTAATDEHREDGSVRRPRARGRAPARRRRPRRRSRGASAPTRAAGRW